MCIVEVLNKWQEMGQSMTTTAQDDCSYDYTYTWRGLLALLKDAEFEILARDLCYALSSTTSSVKKIKQDRDEQTAIDTSKPCILLGDNYYKKCLKTSRLKPPTIQSLYNITSMSVLCSNQKLIIKDILYYYIVMSICKHTHALYHTPIIII